MRTNGILMAISSLPSDYGIGDFGKYSYKFVDLISEAKIKLWQLLPINPIGSGDSPYSSKCGNAIDEIYIDLEELQEKGLIENLSSFNAKAKYVEYGEVRDFKTKKLREAFEKQKDLTKQDYKNFLIKHPWLENYAKFCILLAKNNYVDWWNWSEEEKNEPYKNTIDFSKYENEMNFIKWCQYIAFKQFIKLKKYANSKNVDLMGDIPFYLGGNSSDVWANQDEFLLDDDAKPYRIAGCPPDYFSETGQRWGNPIYDWDYMLDDGFTFWMSRIKNASKLYDCIRIDHFRAFDTYWSINPECETAVDGVWEIGYGNEFFSKLQRELPNLKILAEDLGDLFPSVQKLRDKFNLPGMNVIQFTLLDPAAEVKENQIMYTGTHDNDTLMGWLKSLDEETKEALKIKLKSLKLEGRSIYDKLINYVFSSVDDYAIIPIQDYLKLGSEYRMNMPGISGGLNWKFRLVNFDAFEKIIPSIKTLVKKYNR